MLRVLLSSAGPVPGLAEALARDPFLKRAVEIGRRFDLVLRPGRSEHVPAERKPAHKCIVCHNFSSQNGIGLQPPPTGLSTICVVALVAPVFPARRRLSSGLSRVDQRYGL